MVDQKGESAKPRAESWAIVHEVLKDNPKSVLGLFTEGKFYLLDRKYAEAATSLRRVIDEQPNAAAHVLLGTAYLAQKQNELARSEFQQALQLDAANLPARSQLSALYLEANENENAAREAKAALDQNAERRARAADLRRVAGAAEAHPRSARSAAPAAAHRHRVAADPAQGGAALPPHARPEGGDPDPREAAPGGSEGLRGDGGDGAGGPRRAPARRGDAQDRHLDLGAARQRGAVRDAREGPARLARPEGGRLREGRGRPQDSRPRRTRSASSPS